METENLGLVFICFTSNLQNLCRPDRHAQSREREAQAGLYIRRAVQAIRYFANIIGTLTTIIDRVSAAGGKVTVPAAEMMVVPGVGK